jgi:hypothetical protein
MPPTRGQAHQQLFDMATWLDISWQSPRARFSIALFSIIPPGPSIGARGCVDKLGRDADARQATELRSWADPTVINGAFQARLPELLPADSSLKDVAELCKRDFAARPARDLNDVRDQLLLIGIEWNLDCDRLDQQSDACLRTVAALLR